ncbi:NADH dehydrogenase [ubiquinone] iron-sulfur protein 5 [Anthonomus grandis grandis]|uniref:NADH dehydrogenase [ubiquinone] iron-sulfur protein 5 n=1 Tax=Anthonomus grandis grandis TaxID=2921223 RepID=UPI002165D8F5|nr:NADH dehydrogenase [ubiquinone] iron-sulfur protein 5 [Anthonomus grandis grandis]
MANGTIFNPFLKSPLTDMSGALVCSQWGGKCADIEMRALECLEAYGVDRGLKKCDTLIKDFDECVYKRKQIQRVNAMRFERHRQHFAGERTKEDKYSKNPPKPDTY